MRMMVLTRSFSGCINASVYVWEQASVFVYFCLAHEKHGVNCICMNGSKQVFIHECKQRWSSSSTHLSPGEELLFMNLLKRRFICPCVSLPTGSNRTHTDRHRGPTTRKSPGCDYQSRRQQSLPHLVWDDAGFALTFSKLIANLWIYF